MENPRRGEVPIVIDGERRKMRLTLGALAALEHRLGAGSLLELAERFESGQVRTGELIALLAAGLQGAGDLIEPDELAEREIEGGALGALRAGVALLATAFGRGPSDAA